MPRTSPSKEFSFERSHSVAETYTILAEHLRDNEILMHLEEFESQLEVSHCTIQDGDYSDFGSGKGHHHVIGAMAEALEHRNSRKFGSPIKRSLTIADVANQRAFAKDAYTRYLAQVAPRDSIGTLRFSCVTSDFPVQVPAGFVSPAFFEQECDGHSDTDLKLRKYCSNNGSALGLCHPDTLLHGLNEAIERHYESLLYLELLGCATGADWFIVEESGDSSFARKKHALRQHMVPQSPS